jgi:hypothetical protein
MSRTMKRPVALLAGGSLLLALTIGAVGLMGETAHARAPSSTVNQSPTPGPTPGPLPVPVPGPAPTPSFDAGPPPTIDAAPYDSGYTVDAGR